MLQKSYGMHVFSFFMVILQNVYILMPCSTSRMKKALGGDANTARWL